MTQQDIHDFMTANGFRLAKEFNSPHYVKCLDPYGDGKTDYLNHVSVEQAAQFYKLTLEARRDELKHTCMEGYLKGTCQLKHRISNNASGKVLSKAERLAELNNQLSKDKGQ